MDKLKIIVDFFNKKIRNFPAKNGSCRQTCELVVFPYELSWRVDFAERSQKLIIFDRERIPHICSSLLIPIEFSTAKEKVVSKVCVR